MRRHRLSPNRLVLAVFFAAALIPGAAVVSPARAGGSGCIAVDALNLYPAVAEADVIVVATVVPGSQAGGVALRPEAFLKGAVQSDDLSLSDSTGGDCAPATLTAGQRVVAILGDGGGQLRWPGVTQVWTLKDGQADNAFSQQTEADLIGRIRAISGQYAVPADGADGASINWRGTILPLGGALVVIFVIGLVLMRTWHRIDPT